jgi:hypothetical protein
MDDMAERIVRLEAKQEATEKAMDSIGSNLLTLAGEIRALTMIMERGKGAFAASLAIAGTVGAVALAGLQYFLKLIPGAK